MSAAGVQHRITPPSATLVVAFSVIAFSFLAAGGLVAYIAIRGAIAQTSGLGVMAVILAFGAFLGLIGWLSMWASQGNADRLLEFESASTTGSGEIVNRGQQEKLDQDEHVHIEYWVSVRFRPKRSNIVIRAVVSKKLHDRLQPGTHLRVRYADSNPQMAVLEGEKWKIERPLSPVGTIISWTLATVIGGVLGFQLGYSIGGDDALLTGAIAGLVIGEAQWIALLRHAPVPNWLWALTSLLGWAVFTQYSSFLSGFAGGILLGVLQWQALRRARVRAEWWVPFTALGITGAQLIYDYLLPLQTETIAGASFDVFYGVVTGIALYLIASQSREAAAAERPIRPAQGPAEPEPQMDAASDAGSWPAREAMRLTANEELISESPDEAVIQRTLEILQREGNGFAILGAEKTYIQAACTENGEFIMEYQAGSLDQHYACATEDLSLPTVVKAFTQFLNADERMQNELDWELMLL